MDIGNTSNPKPNHFLNKIGKAAANYSLRANKTSAGMMGGIGAAAYERAQQGPRFTPEAAREILQEKRDSLGAALGAIQKFAGPVKR